MNAKELYRLIGIPEEVVAKLDSCAESLQVKRVEPFLVGMMERRSAADSYHALKDFLQGDEDGFQMLFCQLECVRRIHETYRERQIPEAIFVETMKCFQRFLRETGERTGRIYFDRGWWTYRQTSMRMFRLGELEYEPYESEEGKSIRIHIPSDASILPARVDDSLRQAREFMRRYEPAYADVKYACSSWLLSPVLEELLPEQSNIRAFQRRFAIERVDAEDREYMQWLFQAAEDAEPSNLPERTRLQSAAKQRILQGENIGSAYGVLK